MRVTSAAKRIKHLTVIYNMQKMDLTKGVVMIFDAIDCGSSDTNSGLVGILGHEVAEDLMPIEELPVE